mgnify:CR=1 FL=1
MAERWSVRELHRQIEAFVERQKRMVIDGDDSRSEGSRLDAACPHSSDGDRVADGSHSLSQTRWCEIRKCRGGWQGSRSYASNIPATEIALTVSHLPRHCSQPSVLCSFLPFSADDGNGQADGHGQGIRRA